MITNKQYKQDMMYLLKIIRTLYETDGRHMDLDSLNKLHHSINTIPDEEPKPIRKLDDKNPNDWIKPQHLRDDLPPKQSGFDPNEHESKSWPYVNTKVRADGERLEDPPDPHDLGNILHIPSEDDK